MANPVEEFLKEKKAFSFGGALQGLRPHAQRLAESAGTGVALGLGTAGFAGLTLAAGKIFNAATKARDFNRMLEADESLRPHLEQDPEGFNRMFSALRKMAPEFTAEPLVAASYMRRGMESNPEHRGTLAVSALRDRSFPKPGPLTEAAIGGFSRGVGMNHPDGPKPQLQRQVKSISRLNEGGEPTLDRIEESQNYYG